MFAGWCSRSKHLVSRDANALRNCREVNGNVIVAPQDTANIDLSGPEAIHGSISGTEKYMRKGTSLNISSTTLTTLDGHLSISGYGNPSKVSMPSAVHSVSGYASLYGSSTLKRVVVGFNKSANLILSGSPETKQLEVVLGSESTTPTHIGLISLSGDVSSFQRSSILQKLTADSFQSYENHYKHLHLPFDQLSSLTLFKDKSLEWISVPPPASQWANFSLRTDNTKANLSSEYMIHEKGELVRSWYWPQRDMFRINTFSGNMTLAFL
ncbi:hypothetical protein CI238_00010 [Colletotrichum incanum]|uniref:Uncharacterized protein n=1 Tax=Colletotrichum incanum TaxID=1573173 RepID=A0A166QZC4_COLIC|nr:hypothetical protein CI238_00010 [Colletotrichum incanum]